MAAWKVAVSAKLVPCPVNVMRVLKRVSADSLLLFGVCSVGQETFDRLSVREDCISEVAHGVVKGGLPRELRVVRVHEGEIPVEGIEGVSDERAGFRADDLVFDYVKNYESVKLIDIFNFEDGL